MQLFGLVCGLFAAANGLQVFEEAVETGVAAAEKVPADRALPTNVVTMYRALADLLSCAGLHTFVLL